MRSKRCFQWSTNVEEVEESRQRYLLQSIAVCIDSKNLFAAVYRQNNRKQPAQSCRLPLAMQGNCPNRQQTSK